LGLACGLHALGTHTLVKVLDVVNLDMQEQRKSLVGVTGLLLQFSVILLILGDKGYEEPVHVEGQATWLILASAEAERLVELRGSRQILHVGMYARDTVDLHLVSPS
jgi:hypothetical protein